MTRLLAATQRPFVGAALATPSGPPAWKTLPSWYAVATADLIRSAVGALA